MFEVDASISMGKVSVITTDNRGLSVEEVAQMAVDKILYVAEDAPEPIREQATAFKNTVHGVIMYYMQHAVDQDRATVAARLREAGYPELAKNLRSL
jgi:hypothetical protein|tara:strand:+ start:231 stop:521 length:291 start_codon:yes stop_codon:yes gene_type:complete